MSDSKEFLGKTLDAAIAEACAYYDVPREKLEIDIIEDAKTGIFGIVGARKAKILARLATLPDFIAMPAPRAEKQERRNRNERRREKAENADVAKETTTETPKDAPKEAPKEAKAEAEDVEEAPRPSRKKGREGKEPRAPKQEERPAEAAPENTPEEAAEQAEAQAEAPRGRRGRQQREPREPREPRQPRQRREARPEKAEKPEKAERTERADDADALESALPRVPLTELDQEKLTAETRNIIGTLVGPILDCAPEEVDLSLEVSEDRLHVSVKSEDTGLLIGRDGQNLAAVQYLACRMITRAMGAQIRVQVDAGDYHMRQDTRLQELALSLAEKVKATGKVQTTRPLSAYQRRVIHLALQDDPEVQTRSSGEGALKHVVILRRKD